MKVAVFSTLWGSSTGGIDVCSKELILSLAQTDGHEVYALYKVRTQQLVDDGRKHDFIVLTPDIEVVDDINASQLEGWTTTEARAVMLQLLEKQFKPDLVIINDIFGRELLPVLRQSLTNAKIATLFHNAYGRSEGRKGASDTEITCKENYQKKLINDSDLVFAVGSFSEEYFKNLSPKFVAKIKSIIPGLPNIQTRATKCQSFSAASFGRIDQKSDKIKQISISAKAWLKARNSRNINNLAINDVVFWAIGSTGSEPILDNVKKELENTSTASLRELPFEDVNDFDTSSLKEKLDQCSFVLLNSWYENFSLASLETCTFGVPTIVSQNSGFYVDVIKMFGDEAKDLILSVETDKVPAKELIEKIVHKLIASCANYDLTFENAEKLSNLLRKEMA